MLEACERRPVMRKFVWCVLVGVVMSTCGCMFHDKHACVYLLTESYDIDFSSGSGVEKVSRCLEGNKTHSKHWVGFAICCKDQRNAIYPYGFMWTAFPVLLLSGGNDGIGMLLMWPFSLIELGLRLPTAPIELLFYRNEDTQRYFLFDKPIATEYEMVSSLEIQNDFTNRCASLSVAGRNTPITVPFLCTMGWDYKKNDPGFQTHRYEPRVYTVLSVDADGYVWLAGSYLEGPLEDVPCLVKVSIRTGEVIPVVRHGKDDVFDFKIETTDIKEVSEEQIDLLQHGNSNNFQ